MTDLADFEAVIRERREREDFADLIIELLKKQYSLKNASWCFGRNCVRVGEVFRYLAEELNEANSFKFKKRIKAILVERRVVQQVWVGNKKHFKGIQYKE